MSSDSAAGNSHQFFSYRSVCERRWRDDDARPDAVALRSVSMVSFVILGRLILLIARAEMSPVLIVVLATPWPGAPYRVLNERPLESVS